jgi:hypothetical protein
MGSFAQGGGRDINEDRCIRGAWEFKEKQRLRIFQTARS